MASPRQAVELMIKEAGIVSVDMITKQGYELKRVASRYYLDISGKEKETGIGRQILGPVASLICYPTEGQKKVLKFLLKSEEATKDLLVEKFGSVAYNVTVLALEAMGMVEIKRYGSNISVVKPYHDRIKKFWSNLSLQVQT